MKKIEKIYIYMIVIFLLIIFYILNHYLSNKNKEYFESNEENKKIDLVLSRYNEDLTFLLNDEFTNIRKKINKFIIYNKGPEIKNEDIKKITTIINLPNVGRECHSFLYHIVDNYDRLSDVIIFLPASFYHTEFKRGRSFKIIYDVLEKKKGIFIADTLDKPVGKYFSDFSIDEYEVTSQENKKVMSKNDHKIKLSNERPFKVWFENNFGSDNQVNKFFHNSIFSVSKEDILKNKKTMYEKLMSYLDKHQNPEEGHYMERSWVVLFNPPNENILSK